MTLDARRAWRQTTIVGLAALLAACASRPPVGGRDGAGADTPAGLDRAPDAEPRVEPLRRGGPNKPYEVFGITYVPLTDDVALHDVGLASWYGRKFHGRQTASGERYDMYAMTAAHKTMPIPSYARVRNPANGREVVVRVNDRGPFRAGRVIDLSYTAALKLGLLGGVAPVEIDRLTGDEIRAGLWRRERNPLPGSPPVPEPVEPALARAEVPPSAAAAVPQAPSDLPDGFVRTAAVVAPGPIATASLDGDADDAAGHDALIALLVRRGDLPPAPDAAAAGDSDAAAAPAYWLQLGAFRQRDGALVFSREVQPGTVGVAAGVTIVEEQGTHRVQAGPYPSRDAARRAAARLQAALSLSPIVVERR